MGCINQVDQQWFEEEGVDVNYCGSDYIGKSGVEVSYEWELYGIMGFEQVEIDVVGCGICMFLCMFVVFGNNVMFMFDM